MEGTAASQVIFVIPQLYEQALTTMEGFVNRLAKRVPSPRRGAI